MRRLARDGDGVAVVVGSAGAGKTFALAAAREAWELSGTPVVGAAVAWLAARGLEEEAGIPSTSIAALLARLERDRLPRRCVLVVDEAAMVGTRQMVELANAVHRVRGKLVLVGDHEQVPEIEASGTFRGLLDRLPAIELRENRRQVEPWEQQALALLRDGRGREALDEYEAHGRLRAGDEVNAHEKVVADWWSAGAPERSIMLAYRRADVGELNRRARELMLAGRLVSGPELLVNGMPFAAGDRVLLRRNDRRLGVANGDRALVAAVDVDRHLLVVRVGERELVLGRDYLNRPGRPTLQHGCAMTGHAAQGLTVVRAFVLATEETSREWLYMAMSRGRLENRLYGATAALRERDEIAPAERGRDAAEVLELAVRRSAALRMAIDWRPRERAHTRDFGLDR